MSELTAFLSVFSGYTLFSFSGKFQLYIYQYRTDNTEVKKWINKNKKTNKIGFFTELLRRKKSTCKSNFVSSVCVYYIRAALEELLKSVH